MDTNELTIATQRLVSITEQLLERQLKLEEKIRLQNMRISVLEEMTDRVGQLESAAIMLYLYFVKGVQLDIAQWITVVEENYEDYKARIDANERKGEGTRPQSIA